ncbi:T9SS type A sorting domain-containing protein [Chryseobacterium fluminis]|uniref:T9SS type A sorting domain-containing protein n=1 Tax=Chryseobacterium fluminis TaxID=2983606 RepID=UPI0022583ACB|nr:T9SS type A sorting domain-containing protein [Chryseobacterium sp. MMS21-Ot14]UZT97982.1 T9SS type A sorting domain-containing protein [Chryseobacterium sp. MMS21-Ot14]
MKNFNILNKLFLVGMVSLGISTFGQTTIKVTYYTGATQDYTVDNSGKLYFSGTNLLVSTTYAAANVSIPTNIIRKITFTSLNLATQEIGQNKSKLRLYPNPCTDFIKISSDKKERMNVKIYSSSGILVLKGIFQPDEEINISSLSAGFYLLQAGQTTLKMIKK